MSASSRMRCGQAPVHLPEKKKEEQGLMTNCTWQGGQGWICRRRKITKKMHKQYNKWNAKQNDKKVVVKIPGTQFFTVRQQYNNALQKFWAHFNKQAVDAKKCRNIIGHRGLGRGLPRPAPARPSSAAARHGPPALRWEEVGSQGRRRPTMAKKSVEGHLAGCPTTTWTRESLFDFSEFGSQYIW